MKEVVFAGALAKNRESGRIKWAGQWVSETGNSVNVELGGEKMDRSSIDQGDHHG